MRRLIFALTAIVSISAVTYSLAAPAGRQTGAGARENGEAAIRKLVTRLQDGWNAGDGKAFASAFAENADYVVVNGMRVKGREAIASGHQNIFDTVYKNSNNQGAIQSIRFLRDDVALAHVEWALKYNDNGNMRTNKALSSILLTRENGQWSIAAFHNTPVR